MPRSSVVVIQTKPDWHDKKDAIAKTNIRFLPPTEPCVFNVYFVDSVQDMSSFFHKPIYSFKISIRDTSTASITVVSLSNWMLSRTESTRISYHLSGSPPLNKAKHINCKQ